MARCPTDEELERYLDGRVDDRNRSRIDQHRRQCSTCSEWLEEASADDDLLSQVRRISNEPGRLEGGPPTPASEPALARYRIMRRIGAGGMGVVYEAEQRNPRRRVALKLMQSGALSERTRHRFEHEAQVLGRLDHPGIAKILEADTYDTEAGTRSFFAMELVEGRTLSDFARVRDLTVRQRLELFGRICDAVQHAHQKGVLHRDLKPANILVTDDGQPKVLDFGVARTLDSDLEATRQTERGQIIGTLSYMSPEQVSGDPLQIDTRSDVYALGLILYELLAGRLPYEFASRTLPEAVRVITSQEPASLRTVRSEIPSDLGTIAAKALEKDKERRYESAAALAEDVRRFLRHEPISARPPSTMYQLRRFARRNRALVSGLGIALLGLVFGLTFAIWQARRALQAEVEANAREQEARLEARTVEAVNEFLGDVLGTDDPETRTQEFTVRQALEFAERRIDRELTGDPRVEAAVRVAIGAAYRRRGLYDRAEEHITRGLELRRQAYGPVHPRVGGALNLLGVLRSNQSREEEAVALFQEALGIYERCPDVREELIGTTKVNLGGTLRILGRYEEAEQNLLEGIEIQQIILGEDSIHVAVSYVYLARLHREQGQREDARHYGSLAVEIFRLHPESGFLADALAGLAAIEQESGNDDEATRLLEEALEITARIQGPASRSAQLYRSSLQSLRDSAGQR